MNGINRLMQNFDSTEIISSRPSHLDLMADGPLSAVGYRIEKAGVVAPALRDGLPGWAEPQERSHCGWEMRSDSLTECELTTTP